MNGASPALKSKVDLASTSRPTPATWGQQLIPFTFFQGAGGIPCPAPPLQHNSGGDTRRRALKNGARQ